MWTQMKRKLRWQNEKDEVVHEWASKGMHVLFKGREQEYICREEAVWAK